MRARKKWEVPGVFSQWTEQAIDEEVRDVTRLGDM